MAQDFGFSPRVSGGGRPPRANGQDFGVSPRLSGASEGVRGRPGRPGDPKF